MGIGGLIGMGSNIGIILHRHIEIMFSLNILLVKVSKRIFYFACIALVLIYAFVFQECTRSRVICLGLVSVIYLLYRMAYSPLENFTPILTTSKLSVLDLVSSLSIKTDGIKTGPAIDTNNYKSNDKRNTDTKDDTNNDIRNNDTNNDMRNNETKYNDTTINCTNNDTRHSDTDSDKRINANNESRTATNKSRIIIKTSHMILINDASSDDQTQDTLESMKLYWTSVPGEPAEIHLLSAFYDDRWSKVSDPVISVLVLLELPTEEHPSQMYCTLQCLSGSPYWTTLDIQADVLRGSGIIYSVRHINERRYIRRIIRCAIDPNCDRPVSVALSYHNSSYDDENDPARDEYVLNTQVTLSDDDNPGPTKPLHPATVRVEYPDKIRRHQFGVCVPIMFGCLDPVRIVEWLEMEMILGVTRVVLYNNSLCAQTSAILTVTTLMWVTARYAHPAWRTPLQVRVDLYQYLLQKGAIDC